MMRERATSRQPRMVNSLKVRMSSMRMFIRRSLSLKPTRMKRPLGCSAMLYASSANSLYSSMFLSSNEMRNNMWNKWNVY